MRPMQIKRNVEPPINPLLVAHQKLLVKAYRLGRKGRGLQFNPYSSVTEPSFYLQWERGYKDNN